MRNYRLIISSIFSISVLQGCSFVGLSDFEIPECTTDLDCQQAFNQASGYPLNCAAFICEQGSEGAECKEIALEGEIFDGADNDCDGVIDESNGGQSVILGQQQVITSSVNQSSAVSVSVIDGELAYYVGREKSLQLLTSPEFQATPVASYSQEELATPANTNLSVGCYLPNVSRKGSCSSQDFAVASGDRLSFYAAVNTLDCINGEVRVGVIDPENPTELIDRGDGFRNPAYEGVNTTAFRCSKAATLACETALSAYEADPSTAAQTEVLKSCGARKPNLAAFGDQALLAYVADGFNRTACSETITEVQGLGLSVGEGNGIDGSFYWVNPSNDGKVEVFGQTKSDAPPALLALKEAGFFMAFGDENGDVALSWLPAQQWPETQSDRTCPVVDGDPDCESRSGRGTGPLEGLIGLSSLTAQSADNVQLAWLAADETEGYLALSWTQVCSEGEVFAQVLHLNIATSTPEIIETFEAVQVGSTQGPVALIKAQEDFFITGTSRNDEKLAADEVGGFYISLDSDQGVIAKRIAAVDGKLVDPDESILMSKDSPSIRGTLPSTSELLTLSTNQELAAWSFSPPARN